MSYNWTTGEVITAEKLNSMGVVDIAVSIDESGANVIVDAVGIPFNDLVEKITNNENVSAKVFWTDGDRIEISCNSIGIHADGPYAVIYLYHDYNFGNTAYFSISSDGNAAAKNGDDPFTWTYSNGAYTFTPEDDNNL